MSSMRRYFLLQGFGMAKSLKDYLERHYPNLMRVEDVNHMR